MENARLDEAQTRIKIAGRNINNLRYADDTTLMAESEEKLDSLLMKVKDQSKKARLNLNDQQAKFMAAVTIHSDFGAQGGGDLFFHCFPIYLP